jgi:hypothetical protein
MHAYFLMLDLNVHDQSVKNLLSVHVEHLLQKLSSSVYNISGPEECTSSPVVFPVFDKAPMRTVIRFLSFALENRSTLAGISFPHCGM